MKILCAALASLLAISPSSAHGKKYDDHVYVFKVEDDKFSKSLTYVGLTELINPFGGTARRWSLRTWIDRESKAITHQLYVVIAYSGSWRFYEAAANDKADQLEVALVTRSVDGCSGMCSFSETVGVAVEDDWLRANALTGFQVKLLAKSGDSLVIDVTPAQIQSQLATDNQFLPQEKRWAPPVAAVTHP